MSLQRQILIWIAVLALAVYALVALSGVLMPFAAGIAIAYLLDPLACKLERLGLNRLGASALILALFVAAILLILVVLVPVLTRQLTAFVLSLPGIAARLQDLVILEGGQLVERYGGETLRKLGIDAPLTPADMQSSIGSVVGQAINYIIGFLNSLWSGSRALFGLFSILVVTPVVAFYILLDWRRMTGAIDGWVPARHRPAVRAIARDIDRALAGFVRGQSVVSLILGSWYAVGLTLAGLNFGFLIGITGGFLSFVPFLGSLAVLIVSTAVAVVQGWPEWRLILVTLAVVLSGQFLEGNVLSPYLVGHSIGLHPVWLMLALVVCSTLFGFPGLLIAVPLAAALGVLARFALRSYLASPVYTGEPAAGRATVTFEPRIVEAGRD
jgi:predicted PurR-regulated permease PerM